MSSHSDTYISNPRQGEWSGWEFDYTVNRYRRTRDNNGDVESEYHQDERTAQLPQEVTPRSDFPRPTDYHTIQQSVGPTSSQGQFAQYPVPSSTPAFNDRYIGGPTQRQDYGGPLWTSASTFQAVPSAGPQLPPSTNYSGPTYIPNDFNSTIRYDPVSSIPSQLATATSPRTSYALSSREYDASDEITRNIASLSFSPQPRIQEQRTEGSQGLRDPSSPVTNRYVSANNPKEQTERLDPRFRVIEKPKRFFKVGRVFAVLWSEPAGENVDWSDEDDYEIVRYGEKVHTKIRRFVVVREGDRHSTCLPLLTYQGKGTRKHGVNPDDHAAVFAEKSKPKLLPGENLRKKPFPIIIEDPKEKIDPLTRINFSKIYTVEHNVKALKIGRIPDKELSRMRQYFIDCIAGPEVTSQGSSAQASGSSAQMGESIPSTLVGLLPNDPRNHIPFSGEQFESGDFQSQPNTNLTQYQTSNQGFNQSFDPGGVNQYQQSSAHSYDSGQYNRSNQSNLYSDPRLYPRGEMDNEANSPTDYAVEPERSREGREQDYVQDPNYNLAPALPLPRPVSSMSSKYEGERRSNHGGSKKEKDRDRDRRRR